MGHFYTAPPSQDLYLREDTLSVFFLNILHLKYLSSVAQTVGWPKHMAAVSKEKE